jgi:hypothetical protein
MTQIQAQFNFASISSDREITRMPPIDINADAADLLEGLADSFKALSPMVTGRYNERSHQCGTVSPPIREDRCHPCGSLKADQESGVITTPGGYKIEQIGQYEWKITGQDGKWTRSGVIHMSRKAIVRANLPRGISNAIRRSSCQTARASM